MTAESGKATYESQIRSVINDWASALRAKDVDSVFAHLAEDFVQFSLAPPLQYAGENALDKKGLEGWFSSWQGPLGYEIRELQVTASDSLAYSHSLNRLSGTSTEGVASDMWFRNTLCFRKIDGKWKITHEHESVPFYMDGSFKAAIDLRP